MINQIMKLISVLNSKTKPEELALGAVLGMFAGLLTGSPLLLILIFLKLIILSANMPVFFMSMLVFKLAGYGIDIIGDKIGYAVLTMDFFKNAGQAMMSLPVLPFFKFNYTVVTGNFLTAVVLSPLVWFGVLKFVPFYRKNLQEKVDKFKIVKMIKMSNMFKLYDSYKGE